MVLVLRAGVRARTALGRAPVGRYLPRPAMRLIVVATMTAPKR